MAPSLCRYLSVVDPFIVQQQFVKICLLLLLIFGIVPFAQNLVLFDPMLFDFVASMVLNDVNFQVR